MAPISVSSLSLSLIIANFICIAFSFDPTPPQDFCVADPTKSTQIINGVRYPCKDPQKVTANDFYYGLLDKPVNTSNPFKAGLTVVGVQAVPGLNTLGFSMARLELEPGGSFPLHYHPRASEIHIVIQGQLEVGFISPEQDYKYYSKTLKAGEMFVVPPGLIHVQRSVGNKHTSSYAITNSQNPGIHIVTQAVFGAIPAIDTNYLATVYQLDAKTAKMLQGKHWPI